MKRKKQTLPLSGRLLGIDWGTRRIGLALSDADQILATPSGVLDGRLSVVEILEQLGRAITDHDVQGVIIGLPVHLDGKDSPQSAAVQSLAQKLQAQHPRMPILFRDERFTSVMAQEILSKSGLPKKKRQQKERVDETAAALILQSWLDQ